MSLGLYKAIRWELGKRWVGALIIVIYLVGAGIVLCWDDILAGGKVADELLTDLGAEDSILSQENGTNSVWQLAVNKSPVLMQDLHCVTKVTIHTSVKVYGDVGIDSRTAKVRKQAGMIA